jgi:hypothetical protein
MEWLQRHYRVLILCILGATAVVAVSVWAVLTSLT